MAAVLDQRRRRDPAVLDEIAVRDNIEDDEIIVETAYQPDLALWEPDFKTRRMSQ